MCTTVTYAVLQLTFALLLCCWYQLLRKWYHPSATQKPHVWGKLSQVYYSKCVKGHDSRFTPRMQATRWRALG